MLAQLLLLSLFAQQLLFNGQPIEITGVRDPDANLPQRPPPPASVCVVKSAQKTCYTAPNDFWLRPEATLLRIDEATQAILFSAESYGGSGWRVHLALLRDDGGKELTSLLHGGIELSNQSQHRFFNVPELSAEPIFVTASYIWGKDEAHHGPHRFIVSVYRWHATHHPSESQYVLADSFMTLKSYNTLENDDILTAEAPEWKSRLLRVLSTPPTPSEDRGFTYYLTGSPANALKPQPTKPGYLLAGGGKDQDAAFRWFLQKANHGDILILRGSGADGYHPYLKNLAPQLDSIESIVFQDPKSTSDPFVLERIRQADAIFLAGGDQWNYERLWRNTPVQREINAAIQRGIPIGGTSAGLAVLSEYGFSAQYGGITSEEAAADPKQKKISIERGLINIPALACLITDSHFTQRKREGRLRVFLSNIEATKQCQHPPVGLGIDERTALLLEPDGTGTVVGEGAVHCYPSPQAEPHSARANQTLNVKTCRP